MCVVVGFSLFAGIWTDKLWFGSLGYGSVFSKLIWTRVLLFVVFGGAMALIVGVNLFLAFRLRPMFRPHSPEQANLERYREVVTPLRRLLLIGVSVVFGIFAGVSATGQVAHVPAVAQPRGLRQGRPLLPQGHRLLRLQPAVAALPRRLRDDGAVHRAAARGGRALPLRRHPAAVGVRPGLRRGAGPAVRAVRRCSCCSRAIDYWLDRFDLTSQTGSLITGMTYTREHSVLPAKNILMFIAVICALLFFANIFRRTWLLPGVGLALFAISAVLLGGVWPGLMQRFQVKPDEPDKEASYIGKNIQATRAAFDLEDTTVTRVRRQHHALARPS